jgi:hypothetical protein
MEQVIEEMEQLTNVDGGAFGTRREQSTDPGSAEAISKCLLGVAWISVLLGVLIEILLVVTSTTFGREIRIRPVLADLAQRVSWSTIVCTALALGQAISKRRSTVMGIAGLLAALSAFVVARSLQKAVAQALSITAAAGSVASPFVIALLKGVEYGCLGFALGWIARKAWGTASVHIATGLLVGLVFGGLIIAVNYGSSINPPSALSLAMQSVNEFIFPVGCALTVFAAERLGKLANRSGKGSNEY